MAKKQEKTLAPEKTEAKKANTGRHNRKNNQKNKKHTAPTEERHHEHSPKAAPKPAKKENGGKNQTESTRPLAQKKPFP